MDKLDRFQNRFGKIYEFGWWDLEIISAYAGRQFNPKKFQDKCKTRGVWLTLEGPEHQEMNGQVEVTRRTLRTTTYSLMMNARVSEAYIHFLLMYTSDYILLVLTIKDLINEDIKPTTPFKLATFTRP